VKNIGCTPAETGVEPTVGKNIQSQTQKNNIPAITNCCLGSEPQRALTHARDIIYVTCSNWNKQAHTSYQYENESYIVSSESKFVITPPASGNTTAINSDNASNTEMCSFLFVLQQVYNVAWIK